MRRRARETMSLEDALASLREWWREEAGSDATMSLKAKVRLWLERSREPRP